MSVLRVGDFGEKFLGRGAEGRSRVHWAAGGVDMKEETGLERGEEGTCREGSQRGGRGWIWEMGMSLNWEGEDPGDSVKNWGGAFGCMVIGGATEAGNPGRWQEMAGKKHVLGPLRTARWTEMALGCMR